MSATEIAELCDALPPEKREEVADFARFLLARQADERWESIISSPAPRPRLDAFLRESSTEAAESMDLKRL
jgi:broad specificity phosphatase PhoE